MTSALAVQLREAADAVRTRTSLRPRVGLVLGSGLSPFADTLEAATPIPYKEIPHCPASSAGREAALVVGLCAGIATAVLRSRLHLYEGHTPQEVAFPIRLLGQLGVTTLVVTNAAGAINALYAPGDLMVIEDHINLVGDPLVGRNEAALGPRFPDMSEAYDRQLGDLVAAACEAAGIRTHRGVYVGTSGPSYETPAEVRMARILGADAVGMSTVPEVIAARHLGMRVVGLSCLTNAAAGLSPGPLDHREVLETAERMKPALFAALRRIISGAAGE